MRIGLTTDVLTNQRTGVETATLRLIAGLRAAGHDLTCFHCRDARHPQIAGVRHHLFRTPPHFPWARSFAALFHRACFSGLDVLHLSYPHIAYSRKPGVPVVVTVYDLSPLIFPQFHNARRVVFFRHILPRILQTADRIIAPSHATKDDLVRLMRVPRDKVSVIPLATGIPAIKPAARREDFILYTGTLEPRKNLLGLLRAFALLKKQGVRHKLVISGRKGWGHAPIFELIRKIGLEREIIYKGYVSEQEKTELMRAAALFVYPSFYEGFGIPVLEAMAHGTPVVTSNTSSMPGVVGDAGILVDPYRPEAIAQGMLRALSSPRESARLARKGLKRARQFSTKNMAEATTAVYKQVMRR